MARNQVKSSTKKPRRQAHEKRSQGIEERRQPLRRSIRLQEARQKDEANKSKALHSSPSPESVAVTPSCPPSEPEANQRPGRKRKQTQELEASRNPTQKRLRAGPDGSRPPADINSNRLPADINGNQLAVEIPDDQLSADISDNRSHRVATWLQRGSYPKHYFESGDRTWEDIKADTSARRPGPDNMNRLLARQKSNAFLRNKEADTDAPTENIYDKSLPYRSPGYEQELKDQKSYLKESPEGITDDDKRLCQRLLSTAQAIPQDSLFRDDLFKQTCDKVRTRNETRVIEDISPLIAPSAETLTIYGATELQNLVFGVNEPWNESIPVTKTRPQPDRYAAYSRDAFTEIQIQKLLPMIGNRVPVNCQSFLLATWRSFFPFFACEAKGRERDLDVADKQNAHSMTIAVRGIVELFKQVNRENEVHRKLLAFSISHDAMRVKIYGHYATVEKRMVFFWRHPIRRFDLTEQDGKEKWTAYQFTKNVYFEFMPELYTLICSAIDRLPLHAVPSFSRSILPQQLPPDASFGNTDPESEQPGPQELALSAAGSQNPLGSRKRRPTGDAVLERKLDRKDEELERVGPQSDEKFEWLRQEYDRRIKQLAEAPSDASVDSETLKILEEYNERQKQEHNRLIQQTQTWIANMLRQELERQRQEGERQRQELERQRQEDERQRQELKEQLEQQRQQISKLTETLIQSLMPGPSSKSSATSQHRESNRIP